MELSSAFLTEVKQCVAIRWSPCLYRERVD
jgi:hypothetical protein